MGDPAALFAVLAAFTATLGDLLMLYVSNSRRPELLLPALPEACLWVGAVLGVLGIPFYALGYYAASRKSPHGAARAVFLLGSLGALLGAVIHGITALKIHADLEAGAAPQDPLSLVASWRPTILVLWALAAVLVLTASVLFGWFVTHKGGSAPQIVGLANPALVTIALIAVGISTPLLQSFLIPSAPNLAHLVFFGACFWAHRAGRVNGDRDQIFV
jgi:hypothetical protein